MIFLGIDISTANTGWALVDDSTMLPVEYGVISPKTKDYLENGRIMTDFLVELLKTHKVDHIIMEDLKKYMNFSTIVKLAIVHGQIIYGIKRDFTYYSPSVWRKDYMKGNIKREAAKATAIRIANDHFGLETKSDDIAEALLLAVYGATHYEE